MRLFEWKLYDAISSIFAVGASFFFAAIGTVASVFIQGRMLNVSIYVPDIFNNELYALHWIFTQLYYVVLMITQLHISFLWIFLPLFWWINNSKGNISSDLRKIFNFNNQINVGHFFPDPPVLDKIPSSYLISWSDGV